MTDPASVITSHIQGTILPLSGKYNRRCKFCPVPVHEANSLGICPDCQADMRAGRRHEDGTPLRTMPLRDLPGEAERLIAARDWQAVTINEPIEDEYHGCQ